MSTFPAYLVTESDRRAKVQPCDLPENDLMKGDVSVKVEYSALNYKDALALTNSSPIIRHFPLVPGIDPAGTVTHSDNDRFKAGDAVPLNDQILGRTVVKFQPNV